MVLVFGSVAASAQTGKQSASTNAAQQMIFFIIDDSLIGKHDDIAHRAFLAAGGHIDDLPAEIERRRAAAVQIERKFRALVKEQLLQLRDARARGIALAAARPPR